MDKSLLILRTVIGQDCCPFCRLARVSIIEDLLCWVCPYCERASDMFRWVMQRDAVDFQGALERLTTLLRELESA